MLIAYSIVAWFAALFMILIGVSLAKGNYNWLHGKTFDRLNDNEKVPFAKASSKPVIFLGIGIAISGFFTVLLKSYNSLFWAIGVVAVILIIYVFFMYIVEKRFK